MRSSSGTPFPAADRFFRAGACYPRHSRRMDPFKSTRNRIDLFYYSYPSKMDHGICLWRYFFNPAIRFAFVSLIYYLLAPLAAYIYCVTVLGLQSPFPALHSIDSALERIKEKASATFFRADSSSEKIYDIRTGNPVDRDERFMDEMLDKISKYGERSLTWRERRRMEEISKKRK